MDDARLDRLTGEVGREESVTRLWGGLSRGAREAQRERIFNRP
jgi:hypothetical protein